MKLNNWLGERFLTIFLGGRKLTFTSCVTVTAREVTGDLVLSRDDKRGILKIYEAASVTWVRDSSTRF